MAIDWKNATITGLTIALLFSLGFTPDLSDTHFCNSSELSMECVRVSGTGRTCYPYEHSRIGSKFCAEGWEEIKNQEGTVVLTTYKPIKYLCSVDGCIEMKE